METPIGMSYECHAEQVVSLYEETEDNEDAGNDMDSASLYMRSMYVKPFYLTEDGSLGEGMQIFLL